jgi:hypothetical protein
VTLRHEADRPALRQRSEARLLKTKNWKFPAVSERAGSTPAFLIADQMIDRGVQSFWPF